MSFKEIIQNIEDQKLKAIVLKIKNEGMKKNYFLVSCHPTWFSFMNIILRYLTRLLSWL